MAHQLRSRVSILVVVDWSRQPAGRGWPASRYSRFQSLLWWIGRVNARLHARDDRTTHRFQSLLWWIGRVNRSLEGRDEVQGHVSILVVVDWSRQHHGRDRREPGDARGFNPCCGGLVASTSSSVAPHDRPAQCFNPCCGGLVASTANAMRLVVNQVLFQSLLWWIGRVNTHSIRCRRKRDPGFNPCCGGLVASTAS